MNNENNGIYIHIPWCRRRCPYCNFYLVVGKPEINYEKRLIEEFYFIKDIFNYKNFSTLYFGGGTPSLMSFLSIKRLVDFFKHQGILNNNAEITLEVNPEDISDEYLNGLYQVINRLSFGLQSLDDNILWFLGRKHKSKEAIESLRKAKALGFDLSVDFILGIHGQSQNALSDDIEKVSDLGVNHISTYLLTIEEKTFFYKKLLENKLPVMKDDMQAIIYETIQKKLCALGYEHYEISNYARKNRISEHNQIYWGKGNYLGLGPGAHSMFLKDDGGIIRFNYKFPLTDYLSKPFSWQFYEKDELLPQKALKESLAFGLRNLKTGVNLKSQSLRHQTPIETKTQDVFEKLRKNGYLEKIGENFIIAKSQVLLADAIMREII